MSTAVSERMKRFLGERDDFVLYMFEEDLNMIEKWAAEPLFRRPRDGGLLGLWTNSRNPVVHFILVDNKPAKDYLFLKSPQFKDNTANSMFSYIGAWSFEKPREGYYQNIMANIPTTASRFVFLEVEQKHDYVSFHPILLTKGGTSYGKVEPLRGQNPFRLHDEQCNLPIEKENTEEVKTEGGILANYLGVAVAKVKSKLSGQLEEGHSSSSYASVLQQGNQDNHLKVPESTQDGNQTSTNNTPFPSQNGSKDVSTCTKSNQWYLTDHGQNVLQEISSKLKELVNEAPKISRDDDTHNIMILFSFENKSYVIYFPPNFPDSHAHADLYRTIYSRKGRSYVAPSQVKSKDPIQLVQEIFDIVSKHR
jgi:hypothetical protein